MIFDESRIVMRENMYMVHANSRGWVGCAPSELKLMMQNGPPVALTETPFDCRRPFAAGKLSGSLFYRMPDDYVETPCGHVKDLVWERLGNDEKIMQYVAQLPVPGYSAHITGGTNFWVWAICLQGNTIHDDMAFSREYAMVYCREYWAAMIRYCLYEPTGV